MDVHALSTGTVQVKHSFLFAGTGLRRQLNLLLPDEWSDELPIQPRALRAAGFDLADVDQVVLTHMHSDHVDGAIHVRGPVLVHNEEIAFQTSARSRLFQKALRQPLPKADFKPLALSDGPFGGFERSKRLTDDRILAHGREHELVYLPTHDPDSAKRLAG